MRCLLYAVLFHPPNLLVLDEPLGHLDLAIR